MVDIRPFEKIAVVLLILVASNSSCKLGKLSGTEDICLKRYITEELNGYPKLTRRNGFFRISVENGHVTLKVDWSDNPAPFREETLSAIRNGRNLPEIESSIDSSVSVLIEAEDIVRKRNISGIKSITWTAADPLPPGAGRTTSSAGYGWEQCPAR